MKTSPRLLTLCLTGLLLLGGRPPVGAEERMNVLLLIADDLNTWVLEKPERYSGKVIAPNLQRLGESGLVFKHAYTASPFCVPSRTAMWSGVSPHKSGVYHNQADVAASAPLKGAVSLFETFANAGYSMYGYGKITHGWRGGDVWDDKEGHKRDPRPPNAPVQSVGKGEQDWGVILLPEEEMNDTGGANKAIAILEKDHEKPFFLTYGTFNPHMAWFVPQKYFDMFPMEEVKTPTLNPNDFDDIPPLGDGVVGGKRRFTQSVLEAGLHKSAVQAYLATTAYVDVQHGRVLDALAKSPHKDNTIVIFISDHGFHLAEKDHWQKGTLWEEATNSMLLFRVPGMTKPGGVTTRCVSLQDLYPTLLDLCGIARPAHVDGKSLVPILKNPAVDWESTAISYLYDQYASIRAEQFRYIRYKDGQQEFYDRQKDPHEWKNEADNPEYAEALKKLNSQLPAIDDMASQLVRGKR
ncbi:MAG: sulfatase [Verrucomicrobiota bacterium]